MALYQDLPVFADIYALTPKVFLYTQDYPREHLSDEARTSFGEHIK